MKPTKSQIDGWERRAEEHEVTANEQDDRGHPHAAAKNRAEASRLRGAVIEARHELERGGE